MAKGGSSCIGCHLAYGRGGPRICHPEQEQELLESTCCSHRVHLYLSSNRRFGLKRPKRLPLSVKAQLVLHVHGYVTRHARLEP